MENTIELLKKQNDVLVEAIRTIDDHFYAIKQPAANLALRESLDKILNHSDKLHKGSEMQLTKISYVG